MGKKRTQEEYDLLLKETNPTIIRIGEYRRMDVKTEHQCTVCDFKWEVFPSSLTGTKRSGCPMCKGGTNKVVIGRNDIWTTNPEMASLLADPEDGYKYSQCSGNKVKWKCPNCSAITKPRAISNIRYNGFICDECAGMKSLPNSIMYNVLKSLDIDFEDEKFFDWCRFEYQDKKKRGVYDFYFEFNGNKYIVEMDGYFHQNDNDMSGQSKEMSVYIDIQKDKLAKENGIEIIRIPCIPSTTINIKDNILKSKISELFDLSDINWNECFYKSFKEDIINICTEYNNGVSILELSNKYHKDRGTIGKYLDFGETAGLCQYSHDLNRHPVVCLNDDRQFDMVKDAAEFYDISKAAITSCCIGKYKNAGHGKDEFGLPLVFAYKEDFENLSEYDKLLKIQDSIRFKYYDKMVICLNTKTVFKTTLDAQEWCGSSITANLYEPERCKYSGNHPVTNERLQWMKLKDYIEKYGKSTLISNDGLSA